MAELFSSRLRSRAGAATLLTLYRDILTEQYIRPATDPPVSPLAFVVGEQFQSQTEMNSGICGFGVGQRDETSDPMLVIFAEHENAEVDILFTRLRNAGVPAELRTGVSFIAAARPVKGGDSIGYGATGGASGTLGCVVKVRRTEAVCALTCNHVIANLNSAVRGVTDVWAPGTNRSGTTTDRLGVVYDFQDIDFGPGAHNVIDAALALPDDPSDIDPTVTGIGIINGSNAAPRRGERVKKVGVATQHTTGKYRFDINADIVYPDGSRAIFRNLMGIVGLVQGKDFAAQEDSGSIVVDDAASAVGQVISVTQGIDLTLATPIQPILDYFQADII